MVPTVEFVFDTAATSHIVCDQGFMTNYVRCENIVKWGNAKSIRIQGMGDVLLKFKNNNVYYKLEKCLYMPEC